MLSQNNLQQQHQLMNLARNKLVTCVNMESQSKQYDLRKLVAHANLYDKLSSNIVLNNNLIKEQYLRDQQQQELQKQHQHIEQVYVSDSDSDSNSESDSDSDSDWDSVSESDSDSDFEYEYDFGEQIDNVPRHCKIEDLSLMPSVSHKEYASMHLDKQQVSA
ncbi:hypothetical protein, no similarity [Maudiozyma barnettii]|uniref:Uncharacterized protein n=1 Tax=Maudiozyma barnettii TaxID=61262 RepID=A0A8H2VGD3_9SACH|nr:hypothetical protein, no similarity [Kazachstania barnettii]CAB4254985.1 hypothetical protein, no similarity [Kazachstania barnettii]CAD1783256.1 hypothetical protein, no similarity [Kazachstania barnettii]